MLPHKKRSYETLSRLKTMVIMFGFLLKRYLMLNDSEERGWKERERERARESKRVSERARERESDRESEREREREQCVLPKADMSSKCCIVEQKVSPLVLTSNTSADFRGKPPLIWYPTSAQMFGQREHETT